MSYKVSNIQTGQIIKAGFKSEEAAKDWLETHRPGREENYLAEEMDEDELEEWRAEHGDEDDPVERDDNEEEDFEEGRYTYSTDDEDEGDDEGDLLSEVDDEDDD